MGDRELKMFKYHNTLYIIDPQINDPYKAASEISYFTIEELPTRNAGLVDYFSQEAITIKEVSQDFVVSDGDHFESF